MKVDQIFENARAAGTMPVSFEMFPPKGELTLERAREVAGGFAELAPDFVSVTYSAGGSGNSAATAKIAQMISDELGLTSVAHLTCISLTPETLGEKIAEFRSAGIENVLALRGDLPDGMSEAEADGIAFPFAKDLVPALVDAGFCVGGAAYPEGHLTCDDLVTSVKHLKQKQDAGASFLVTQLFFDNECFYRFRELADAAHTGHAPPRRGHGDRGLQRRHGDHGQLGGEHDRHAEQRVIVPDGVVGRPAGGRDALRVRREG